jgi:pyruvate/2-oxoglutarate dehydrogenase complex dihydrolipoamide acyltransferase (E2) component
MGDLRNKLEQITSTFVSSLLAAMKSASLADLAGEVSGAARAPAAPRPATRRAAKPAKAAPAVAVKAPSVKPARRGRRHRASPAEVQAQKDAALTAARALRGGFSKGDVMRKSSSKVDLGRALSLLVSDGKLSKKGDRRKTRYWVR